MGQRESWVAHVTGVKKKEEALALGSRDGSRVGLGALAGRLTLGAFAVDAEMVRW